MSGRQRKKAARGGAHRMGIDGEMTIRRAQALKAMLLETIDGNEEVDVDLSAVKRIDTAGMQLLIMLKRECQLRGRTANFVNHSAAVQELMDLYDLGSLFGDPVLISARKA